MSNGWAVACRILALIELIGGIFGSIIAATETNMVWISLLGISVSIVGFCILGTLSYIADQVGKAQEKKTVSSVGPSENQTGSGTDFDPTVSYPVNVYAYSYANLFKAVYSVKVFIDDQLLGIVENSRSGQFKCDLKVGGHVLRLEKEHDRNVNGTLEFNYIGGSTLSFNFQSKLDAILIDTLSIK